MRAAGLVIAFIAGLLLTPLPSLGQVSPPEVPPTVLSPVELRITGPPPRWLGPPSRAQGGQPTDTAILVTVANLGDEPSASYSLTYAWESGGERGPLNEDNSSSFDVGGPLNPGQTRSHDAPWRLQDGQAGQGAIIVHLEERSIREAPFNVTVPAHDFGLAVLGGAQTLGPDQTALWQLVLRNNGSVPEQFNLRLRGDHTRLDERLVRTQVAVSAASTAQVRFWVHYPFQGLTTNFNGPSYAIEAHVTSLGPGTIRTVTVPPLSVDHDRAPPERRTTVLPDAPGPVFFDAGQELEFRFAVANRGEGPEQYRFESRGEGGWTIVATQVQGLDGTDLVLGPEESADVRVKVRAPSAAPGTLGGVELRATPHRDDGLAVTAFVPVRLHGPAVEVRNLTVSGPGPYVGDRLRAQATLENVGDHPLPPGATLDATVTFNDQSVLRRQHVLPTLPPGGVLQVSLDLGSSPAPGPAHVSARLSTQAAADAFTAGTVVHSAGLAVLEPVPLSGVPGQSVSYRSLPHAFRVRNLGDQMEDVRMEIVRGDGILEGPPQVSLAAGEDYVVPLAHHLSSAPGAAKQAQVAVRAWLLSAPRFTAEGVVNTSIVDRAPPRIQWAQSLPAQWVGGRDLPVGVRIAEESVVAEAWLQVRSAATHSRLPLNASDGWMAQLRLPVGLHQIAAGARDVHGNVGSGPNHTLLVRESIPPQILDFQLLGNGSAPYRVVARILSQDPLARLRLVVDGGAPQEVDPVGFLDVPIALTPGNHTVGLEATDAEGRVSVVEHSLVVPVPPTPTVAVPKTIQGESKGLGTAWPLGLVGVLWAVWAARPRSRPR